MIAAGALTGRSQNTTIFLSQGKIEFQRSNNLYAQMNNLNDGESNDWTDLAKKNMNHFKNDYFDLFFHNGKTLYKPGRETTERQNNSWGWRAPAQDNIVWTDLDNAQEIAQKNVFDDLFLVQDSTRRVRWKITTETRTIAGFNCRRANAIMMDSIYVVAFYTDEILTTGGPESFNGLPGMILGVALPHEHITWMATKVEAISVPETQLTAPVKGKKTNNAGLLQAIKPALKDWGKTGPFYIQAAML